MSVRITGMLVGMLLLAGCQTAREKVKENNNLRDEQECRSKGGLMISVQYGSTTCVKITETIPLTGAREAPPVDK